jgi:signal transduction histidine kinase
MADLPPEAPRRLTLRTSASGTFVQVEVADTGPGIAREQLSRIFDPFFTTKNVGEGTGLGLSIVRNILENHSAKIDVQSGEGTGTTFAITLRVS